MRTTGEPCGRQESRAEVGRDVARAAETWRGRQRCGEGGSRLWRAVSSSGEPWHCLESRGIAWRAVALSGEPWHYLEGRGIIWRAVALPGGPWHRLKAVASLGKPWHRPGRWHVLMGIRESIWASARRQGRQDVIRIGQLRSGNGIYTGG